jgi:hypothetical protein
MAQIEGAYGQHKERNSVHPDNTYRQPANTAFRATPIQIKQVIDIGSIGIRSTKAKPSTLPCSGIRLRRGFRCG